MIRFLSESDVEAAITMTEALAIVEAAFGELGRGQATLLPGTNQTLAGTAGMFRTLAATLPMQHWFGLKTLTGFPGRRLPQEIYFVILLFETGSGALRAIVSANYLTGLRTGAASGVAARYLAREDAASLGIVGAGVQAWHQAVAIAAVRKVRIAGVFSRDTSKAQAFALRMREELAVEAIAVASAEAAVRRSDLVIAATTASAPLIEGAWLEPGTYVSAIGANTRSKRELDPACFARARVIADSREQVLAECGDLRDAVEQGVVTSSVVSAELGDLVAGLAPGRSTSDEITLFKSVGLAIQDVAIAGWLYQAAQSKGLGVQLDPHSLSTFPG